MTNTFDFAGNLKPLKLFPCAVSASSVKLQTLALPASNLDSTSTELTLQSALSQSLVVSFSSSVALCASPTTMKKIRNS